MNVADKTVADATVVDMSTQMWLDELAATDPTPLHKLSPSEARDALRAIQAGVTVELPPAEIEDRVIPGGPTGEVDIRIVRPVDSPGMLPLILHCHGGGWILGDKDTHERLYRELATLAHATLVFVDYTPAPEAQFPVQNEQAWAALDWAVANALEIGADPTRAGLIGESVGGNMTAALTLMAKERGGPPIAAQVLLYPVTNADLDTATYRRYADGPWLTRATMRWFWDAYLPDVARRSTILASPLQASVEQLRGLPPALVINGEHDVLCAEGEAYARKLSRAGVPVTQVRYGGTIHDFALLNPIATTPAPRAAIAQAANYLRTALAA